MDDFMRQRNIRQLLLNGSFKITKRCSSAVTCCRKLPNELLAKPIDELFHHENNERFLGVKRSLSEDSIGIQRPKFDCLAKTVWSQRKALNLTSKIFNPLV